MRSFKTILLASASALLATAALSAPASAADINGGGSSLIVPYMSQAFLCRVGGDTTRAQRYDANGNAVTIASPSATCSDPDLNNTYRYLTSGSGAGMRGLFSQDKENLQSILPGTTGSFNVGTKTGMSSVEYSASDAALAQSDLDSYNLGANSAIVGRTSFQGITIKSVGGTTGTYDNPTVAHKALIQAPLSVDGVALAYNAQYKNASGQTFAFHIATADGKMHLDKATYCGIYNGTITDWNQVSNSLNAGVSLKNTSDTTTFSAPITAVRRSDNSGTTAIFTHHLADVCASTNSHSYYSGTNFYTDANLSFASYQQLPTSVQALANVVPESGSGAVATEIGTTPGSIGYIGPDYVIPNNANTNATPQSLNAASLQVAATSTFVQPTAAASSTAFTATPPQSNSDGTFNAMAAGHRINQFDWVPLITDPSSGYPIIGTTNFLLYTQYDTDSMNALVAVEDPIGGTPEGFLRWYYDSANTDPADILNNAGLGRMPDAWNTAITESFIDGSDGLNLQIHD